MIEIRITNGVFEAKIKGKIEMGGHNKRLYTGDKWRSREPDKYKSDNVGVVVEATEALMEMGKRKS